MQLTCRFGQPSGICLQASVFKSAATTHARSPNLLAALHNASFRSLVRPPRTAISVRDSTSGSNPFYKEGSLESHIDTTKRSRDLSTQGWSRGIHTMSAGGEPAQVAVIGAGGEKQTNPQQA